MNRGKVTMALLAAPPVLVLGLGAATARAATPQSSGSPISPASASGKCRGGNVCVFEDSNFNGAIVQLPTNCGANMNLDDHLSDKGYSLANKVSSIDFPGSGSKQAHFYDNGHPVITVTINHYLKNLAKDSSSSGGNANDKIDSVQITC